MAEFKDIILFVLGLVTMAIGWLWKRAVRKIDSIDERVAALEGQDLMDAKGVWEVFEKQQQALSKVEDSLRRDMTTQHTQLRTEMSGRMDELKTDLRDVNKNVMRLIERTPSTRSTDP